MYLPGWRSREKLPEGPGRNLSHSPRMMPLLFCSSSSVTSGVPPFVTEMVTGPEGTLAWLGAQPWLVSANLSEAAPLPPELPQPAKRIPAASAGIRARRDDLIMSFVQILFRDASPKLPIRWFIGSDAAEVEPWRPID